MNKYGTKLPRKLKKKLKTSVRFRVDYLINRIRRVRATKVWIGDTLLTNENACENELNLLLELREHLKRDGDTRPFTKQTQIDQHWMRTFYESLPDLSEQYKQFEAAHGKEIDDALAKDFGAIGIHCQQLMDKYK